MSFFRRKRTYDPRFKRPDFIQLNHVTTDPVHGSVQLDQLKLQSNDQILLDQLLIQMIRLHNIPECYHYITMKRLDSTPRPRGDVAQIDMVEVNDELWDLHAFSNEIPAVQREIENGYLVD